MNDPNEFEWPQWLRAAVDRGADDLHITGGQPPVARIAGHLLPLQARVLAAEDCRALMQSITPERNQQELQERARTDFGFAFANQGRFRVAVFKEGDQIGIVLRRIRADSLPGGPVV